MSDEPRINWEAQYRDAVKWQQNAEATETRQLGNLRRSTKRHVENAIYALQRFYEADLTKRGVHIAQMLADAQKCVAYAQAAYVEYAHYRPVGLNPFLVDPEEAQENYEAAQEDSEGPEDYEDYEDEEEAVPDEEEPQEPLEEASEGEPIQLDESAVEVLAKPVEATYGTRAMKDVMEEARLKGQLQMLRSKVEEIQRKAQEQIEKMMGPAEDPRRQAKPISFTGGGGAGAFWPAPSSKELIEGLGEVTEHTNATPIPTESSYMVEVPEEE